MKSFWETYTTPLMTSSFWKRFFHFLIQDLLTIYKVLSIVCAALLGVALFFADIEVVKQVASFLVFILAVYIIVAYMTLWPAIFFLLFILVPTSLLVPFLSISVIVSFLMVLTM